MILLRNVSFSYDGREVLKNCSLTLESGETHLIIGPTGAGKTTIAQITASLLKPTSGRVIYPRGDIRTIYRDMGFLFQFPEDLFFNDTVYEEIAFGARKHNEKNIDIRIKEIIKTVGLDENILKKSPFNLSEGEKRLVAYASILIWDPSWIILDEPFTCLDWKARERMVNCIRKLRGEVGLVIITHKYDDIIQDVDRVTLLTDGKIFFTSEPAEVDWALVIESGCSIPFAVETSIKLRENGMKIPIKYTIESLVNSLKQ